MRLWSLHPKYLDTKGLTAVWREALLAQAVLRGRTRGYKNHPQLIRFRDHRTPLLAINAYLWHLYLEAKSRGYSFDERKVRKPGAMEPIAVNRGQMAFEITHLKMKLKKREPGRWRVLMKIEEFDGHPLMILRIGEIEAWERQ